MDIAIVGEAPGFHETFHGKPFVGPSGKVADEVLRYHGIKRENVWVDNACGCRPVENETPSKVAIDACRPRLIAELERHAPKHVIAMGAVATQSVFGEKQTMAKIRIGPPKSSHLLPGVRVIPTWHPAFALRNADALPSIALDVGKARGAGGGDWVMPWYAVVKDPATALDVIGQLHDKGEWLSVDIETGFDKDELFEHADQYGLLCIGIGWERGKVVVIARSALYDDQDQPYPEVIVALTELFQVKKLIMHNGKSDVAGLMGVLGPTNLAFDTMLAHYTIDERVGHHSLGELGIELLGVHDWKAEFKTLIPKGSKNYGDAPPYELWRYNAIDVDVTWWLFEIFSDQMERENLRATHDFLVEASKDLVYLEMEGIAFDREYSKDLSKEMEKALLDMEFMINTVCGRELNPRSPKQIIAFFEEHGVALPKGKNKKPTTEAEALKRFVDEDKIPEGPVRSFVYELMSHRRESKLHGTFVKSLQKQERNGRIHTSYTLQVTTSGRLSSKSPNLQNIDKEKKIRRQFIAADGNILIQSDYSQAEGRVIATEAQDRYLRELFLNEERDIFDEITEAIYGHPDPDLRRLIKTFFYGLAYGRTAHGIAKGFNISIEEASRQLEAFKSLIPDTMKWQGHVQSIVLDQGELITPIFGRHRRFPLITNANRKDVMNEALSYVPQSVASDICLDAFVHLRRRLEREQPELKIRLTIHDALVVEAPIEMRELATEIMREEMVASGARYTGYVPFKVESSYGTSWGDL